VQKCTDILWKHEPPAGARIDEVEADARVGTDSAERRDVGTEAVGRFAELFIKLISREHHVCRVLRQLGRANIHMGIRS
jgi:hypothetical protein